MITSFKHIKPLLKFKGKFISIDNLGFKLHYRATFLLLLTCTILVTSRQYIGEHIRCITSSKPVIPANVINNYCFSTTTFTVVRFENATYLELQQIPYLGIGPEHKFQDPKVNKAKVVTEKVRHHAYYQWVPFVLFVQGLFFYFPHKLWKSWEGGKIKKLVEGLQKALVARNMEKAAGVKINNSFTVPSEKMIDKQIKTVKTYFMMNIKVNRSWTIKMVICEVLNLVNVILQVHFTNIFLGRQFMSLGPRHLADGEKTTTLDVVFPKMTKCVFHKYGASGTIQNIDALCVMALNIINEKIFVFLWFWYLVLVIVSILALVWRALTLFLHSRSNNFNCFVFSLVCPGRIKKWDMMVITTELYFSDWLFLYYLASNMEPLLFRQMLVDHIIPEIQNEIDHTAVSSNSHKL